MSESKADHFEPPEGTQHFGCPTCGIVWTLPWDDGEPPPYCKHGPEGQSMGYHWREPHPEKAHRWTQTVPVDVGPKS